MPITMMAVVQPLRSAKGMRWLALLVVMFVASTAFATPYDVGWGTISVGAGNVPVLSGSLAERLERDACDQTSCPLSTHFVIGGGIGRWAVQFDARVSPLTDAGAADARDRDRTAFRGGPVVRYSLVRRYGFDLSVRGGVQVGALFGGRQIATHQDPSCTVRSEGIPCPVVKTTYEPESYSLVALPLGATLRLGLRISEHGFVALFADVDYAWARVSFPDEARTGALRTMTCGVSVGAMFDR